MLRGVRHEGRVARAHFVDFCWAGAGPLGASRTWPTQLGMLCASQKQGRAAGALCGRLSLNTHGLDCVVPTHHA
eukprot:15274880-Alexandrium_andersonii.AAC.1